MLRSGSLWRAHYSIQCGYYFGGLYINNTLIHSIGAGEEVYMGGRGDAWHPGQLSNFLSPKGPIQNYQSSIIGELFSFVINRTFRAIFSLTTWENLQRPQSYTWHLLPGASQSRVMPSSVVAAGCTHRQTARQMTGL